MRHSRGNKKLGKPTDQRLSMLKAQVMALFRHDRIKLTLTRAKAARRIAEKAITISKENNMNARRKLEKIFGEKDIIKVIFKSLPERFKDRPGGYTRITRIGFRKGDAAPLALLELV